MGQRRQGHADAQEHRADHGDQVAAVPAAQPAGQRHGDHGARGDPEQRETQGARGRPGLFLDGGDAHDPAGEDEAVQGEEGGQGESEPDEVGTRHGTVRTGFVY
ncbi:hypothetical protein GCM10019016_097280 [Streptomyces prasinosporus]|uniref:Uncharacterized protein n=1 Tax=Streptomyces prasinosporus TaxID=68256 RepID=A0ABP6U5B9_9ACTN